jgi:type IV secretory pathway ATPase VirB11/archaellum biosynthesis ATPase
MERTGLTPEDLKVFQGALSRPQGMVLVTGPTGSGKSATLYTAVTWVKSPTTNIITVEDTIDYQLDGVNQVQINPRPESPSQPGCVPSCDKIRTSSWWEKFGTVKLLALSLKRPRPDIC